MNNGAFGLAQGGGMLRVGTTFAGPTTESITGSKQFLKRIVSPVTGLLTGICAHYAGNGVNVVGIMGCVFADASWAPGTMLAYGGVNGTGVYLNTTRRWLTVGVICPVEAGVPIWIAFGTTSNVGSIGLTSGGGSDRTLTATNTWVLDTSNGTLASTTNDYSIHALILPDPYL
jgi:hypothetical protein